MTTLDARLRDVRTRRKALVPYFIGGLTADWTTYVSAAILAGADVIEVGVPFSDPMMDGPVIQAGALRALANDVTLESICHDVSVASFEVPVVVMTYYNVLHHFGLARSAELLAASGVAGVIVPDLAIEELTPWREVAMAADVATVLMVAPSSPIDRVRRIGALTQGFVYAAARMAVTGRAADVGDAERVVTSIRTVCDTPTYVGIGITTPDQASDAAAFGDGVIVGSALVQQILDGACAQDIEGSISTFREALDRTAPEA